MDLAEPLLAALDFAMREAALFAAVGFLLLGLNDLVVDLIWIGLVGWHRLTGRSFASIKAETLPPPEAPGRMAVFTPVWDEAGVIGPMLRRTLATFDHGDYRIYVGCYPNDPATIAEVEAVRDDRVRLVIGPRAGPTTKADCLNRLWDAMLADEEAEGRTVKAVVLHDAEDLVHRTELGIFDRLIESFDLVQLPVRPLIDPGSRWVAGHYADEFAESHGKEMVVREAVGAALPSAGVGCAFSRAALARMAAASGSGPFDATSLTEDYELGLRLRAVGGRQAFVRLTNGGTLVTTEEYFPATLKAAVVQKARWMTGIALSGWDRLGWAGGIAERWMRLRDRQSMLAAVLLAIGYASFAAWALLKVPQVLTDWAPAPIPEGLGMILQINLALLVWRLSLRFAFTARAYGWREGLRAIPRVLVSNVISMLAAWRALTRYRAIRKGAAAQWDKTAHAFPQAAPVE